MRAAWYDRQGPAAPLERIAEANQAAARVSGTGRVVLDLTDQPRSL